jgi:hypothetical protein
MTNKPLMFKSPTGEEIFLSLQPMYSVNIGSEWVEVPAMFHRMAMAHGCIRNDMSADAIKLMEDGSNIEQTTNESHEDIILAALKAMVADDNDDDFTSNGYPDLRKLRARTGFGVDRDDMLRIWEQMKADAGDDVEHGDAT